MARLDEFAPEHQFNEVHGIRIRAPRNRAYRAIKEVTAGEIALFRALTWIRRLGRKGRESILDPPKDEPVLAVATRTGFLLLADIWSRRSWSARSSSLQPAPASPAPRSSS